MKQLTSICLLALLSITATADLGLAQAIGRQPSYSAAFLRDICTGQRAGISPKDQDTLCRFYLSSFHDAIDEYGEAGLRLFCPSDAMSVETMRAVLTGYIADLPESADFLPGGRILVQALARAYPCKSTD
jgi:Rap1a immunity proteins